MTRVQGAETTTASSQFGTVGSSKKGNVLLVASSGSYKEASGSPCPKEKAPNTTWLVRVQCTMLRRTFSGLPSMLVVLLALTMEPRSLLQPLGFEAVGAATGAAFAAAASSPLALSSALFFSAVAFFSCSCILLQAALPAHLPYRPECIHSTSASP